MGTHSVCFVRKIRKISQKYLFILKYRIFSPHSVLFALSFVCLCLGTAESVFFLVFLFIKTVGYTQQNFIG